MYSVAGKEKTAEEKSRRVYSVAGKEPRQVVVMVLAVVVAVVVAACVVGSVHAPAQKT